MTREQGWMSFSRRRPPNLGRCRPQALTMCPLPPPPRTRRHPLGKVCVYTFSQTLPQRNLHPRPGRAFRGLRGSHEGNPQAWKVKV